MAEKEEGNPRQWSYAVLFANGGSGSKRLLRTFDHHPRTHCRNEPYLNPGSTFARLRSLPRGWIVSPEDAELLAAEWDAAMQEAACKNGNNDLLPSPPKAHSAWLSSVGAPLVSSRTVRRALGVLAPGWRQSEWPVPRFVAPPDQLRRAFLVVKFNQSPGFARWLLENRPDVKVVHLVRHPAGCLNSWRYRHLSWTPPEEVHRASRARLETLREAEPAWAEAFGDLSRASLDEVELLFWLYATTTIHRAGKGKPQYEVVRDDEITGDADATLRRTLAACGLEFVEEVEAYVRAYGPRWRESTHHWKELVPEESRELVERLVGAEEMRGWWDADQRVSGIQYEWK